MIDDLYQQHILDHFKHPRNFGEISHPTHRAYGTNSSCGDALSFTLSIQSDADSNFIQNIAFQGEGCALSVASASILTEKIKNSTMKVQDVMALEAKDVPQMMGIEVSPARMKCVTLALLGIQQALKKDALE